MLLTSVSRPSRILKFDAFLGFELQKLVWRSLCSVAKVTASFLQKNVFTEDVQMLKICLSEATLWLFLCDDVYVHMLIIDHKCPPLLYILCHCFLWLAQVCLHGHVRAWGRERERERESEKDGATEVYMQHWLKVKDKSTGNVLGDLSGA